MSYNQFLHRQQLNTFSQIEKKYLAPLSAKQILEIGPGHGFWTNYFVENKCLSYTGVEISEKAVEELKQQFPSQTFIHADIGTLTAIPISHQIDIAFAAMVFLHITDNAKIEQAFQAISQQLTTHGYFILLDTITTKKVFGRQLRESDGNSFDDSIHNKIRYKQAIEKIAFKNQLELVEIIPAYNSSQNCFDFNTKWGYWFWARFYFPIHRRILENSSEKTGFIYSKIQIFADAFFTRFLKLSMGGKWLIFKKNN